MSTGRAVAGTAVNLAVAPAVAARWVVTLAIDVARVVVGVGGMLVLAGLDVADGLLYSVDDA